MHAAIYPDCKYLQTQEYSGEGMFHAKGKTGRGSHAEIDGTITLESCHVPQGLAELTNLAERSL